MRPDVTFALCISGGGDYDSMGFAVVTITPAFAKLLLKLMKVVTAAKQMHKSTYRLEAFDYTATFYDGDELGDREPADVLGEAAAKELERGGTAVIIAEPAGIEPARMECNTVVVHEDDVHWSAYRKNGDFLFTTSDVTRAQLEAIAAGKPLPRVKT